MGQLDLFRLCAEVLLESDFPLTRLERDELERVVIAPTKDDAIFLSGFDRYLEEEC